MTYSTSSISVEFINKYMPATTVLDALDVEHLEEFAVRKAWEAKALGLKRISADGLKVYMTSWRPSMLSERAADKINGVCKTISQNGVPGGKSTLTYVAETVGHLVVHEIEEFLTEEAVGDSMVEPGQELAFSALLRDQDTAPVLLEMVLRTLRAEILYQKSKGLI